MKFQKTVLFISLFSLIYVAACNSSVEPISQTPILTVEPTAEKTKVSRSLTSPSTNTPIPLPTWTPLPTLAFNEAHDLYMELLETNAGCLLPCWWGITPGKTKWQDAKQYLETFSVIINDVDPSKDISGITVHLPLLKDQGTLSNDYYVRDGVVHWITAFNFDWATPLYLSNFLNTYGAPDEIYFRVFYPGFQEEKYSFLIDLYYENGILMEYSGGDKTAPMNGIHKNCYIDMYSPFIYLWSPDEKLTATEALDTFLDNRNFPYPKNLKDATGTDVSTLYNEFRKSDTVKCLETQQELWE